MEFNFLKYDLNKIDHLGADYDTCSVMHYGATAFAKVTICNTAVHCLIQRDCDGRGQPTASPMLTATMSGGVGISGRELYKYR